jgi:hypothetical protein
VLIDAGDDLDVTRCLLDRHHLGGGTIVVHPTPATRSHTALAADLIVALGRPVRHPAGQPPVGSAIWQAATAIIVGDQVHTLVILRAHLLSPQAWNRLLDLRRAASLRLVLVNHAPAVASALAATLTGIDHQILRDAAQVLAEPIMPTRPAPIGPDPLAVNLPTKPTEPQMPHYRADMYRKLPPDMFARIDTLYRHGMDTACDWLGLHPHPGPHRREPDDHGEDVDRFLVELVHNSPTRQHTTALLRGAQAGFLAHGYLLDIPPLTPLTGPGLTSHPITVAVAERIRANVTHPLTAAGVALALITGVGTNSLTQLPVNAISADLDTVAISWPGRNWNTPKRARPALWISAPDAATAIFHVPAAARPLLHAAVTYHRLTRNPESEQQLLPSRFANPAALASAASHCQLPLRGHQPGLLGAWQLRISNQRIGPPIHPEPHAPCPQATHTPDHSLPPDEPGLRDVGSDPDGESPRRRRHLDRRGARDVLHLLREHLAQDNPQLQACHNGHDLDLVRRQLATRQSSLADSRPTVIHPDVLFGLRLIDRPSTTPLPT